MTTIWLKQHSLSISGKKSQVMTIDMIFSYLIFAFFLFYVSVFVVDLIRPFSSGIGNEIMQKKSQSLLYSQFKDSMSINDFEKLCEYSSNETNSIRAFYEAKSFLLPYYDSKINASILGIHFERKGLNAKIIFNTNSSQKISLKVYSKKPIIFQNLSYNEYDDFNITSFEGKHYIEIFSNSSVSINSYELTSQDLALIFFDSYGYKDIFFGSIPSHYSCGDFKVFEEKTLLSQAASINNAGIIADCKIEVWFE